MLKTCFEGIVMEIVLLKKVHTCPALICFMLLKTSSNVFEKVCRVNRHRSILILKTNIDEIIVDKKIM